MKKIFLIITLILFFVQGVFALTASSENYSVSRFGTGVQATNFSSADLTGRAVLLANAGTRNAENNIHTANIGFWANTSYHVTVSITSYSIYPSSAVQGSIIRLSISALNSQSVWAVLTLPNTTQETILLTNKGDVYYTANSVGVYTATFYANSSQGNIASAIDTFEITSSAIPPTPSPSRGGTITITKNCTYVWDCTPWSICSDLNQTRECKNLGNCTGIQSKPIETRVCSDALFDVVMRLKDVSLTHNETLKFGIDLTERGGVEKIDVQIKYSIINSNNTEIFSQVETRAIKGNLTYEKELNEIKLTDGEYTLRVDIIYGNLQRAFAEQKFVVKKGELETPFNEKRFIYGLLIIGILIFLIVLRILIRIWLIKKKKKKHKNKGVEYKRRINKNLKKIRSKTLLIILLGSIVIGFLFTLRKNIIGSIIYNPILKTGNWNILGFILLMGVFGFLVFAYRKKIVEKIENKRRDKKAKNSLKGLIKKEVYTEEGNYVGNVEEILLEKNKVNGLRIRLDKKHNFKVKGIIVRYKHVQSVGHVVIVDNCALRSLEDIKSYKNRKYLLI